MLKKPSVSVLIPVYNVEKYLEQCLNSVISQSLKDIEIICINDGSTDSSLSILRKYESIDDRIIVVDKQNTGYGASMNIALGVAKGDYIGIVESDDYAELSMFEKLYKMAIKDNLDVARSEFFYFDNRTGINRKSKNSNIPKKQVLVPRENRAVFYQQPSIWANIYKRQFLVDNEIKFLETPGASYQDTSFTFKVYMCANRFEMISDCLIHYRTFAGSSSFVNNSKVYCVCDEYAEIERFLIKNGKLEIESDLFCHLKYNTY